MSGRKVDVPTGLFEEMDGPHLIELGNWLASSLDVSELGTEEVLLLHMLLVRCQNGVRAAHDPPPDRMRREITRLVEEDDDDDGDT